MSNIIKVNGNQNFMGVDIPVVLGGFGKDKKCISDKAIAEIHGVEIKHVRELINRNIGRFSAGVDYLDLKVVGQNDHKKGVGQSHTLELLQSLGYSQMQISKSEHIYLLSERGYAKLIKIMDSDLAWEIHDKLIDEYFMLREEVKKQRLGEVNSAARLIAQTLKEAGVAPQFRAVALKNIYEPAGIAIPLDGITMPSKLYEPTEIAKMFGMCSKSGKPHGQAMAALIRKLPLEDREREVVPFSNQQSGHSGTAYQYAETILPKVRSWLENNGYPTEIHEGDRTFKVAYEESLSA